MDYEEIINNFINGNITTFKETVKKLRKKDLVGLIEYCQELGSLGTYSVLNAIFKLFR